MAAAPLPRLTPDQYLELELKAEFKSEYLDGQIFAMAGASLPHELIVSNLMSLLGPIAIAQGCRLLGSNMRLRTSPDGLYTYPDLTITCGRIRTSPPADTLENPTAIFEILSPSTEAFDRGRKFELYQTIPTLREYTLISQEKPRAEQFVRAGDNLWTLRFLTGMDAVLHLQTLAAEIPLAAIYRDVDLSPQNETGTLPDPRPE
jgi:Uma2 family endonuclease